VVLKKVLVDDQPSAIPPAHRFSNALPHGVLVTKSLEASTSRRTISTTRAPSCALPPSSSGSFHSAVAVFIETYKPSGAAGSNRDSKQYKVPVGGNRC
jgi:hypothetical protein